MPLETKPCVRRTAAIVAVKPMCGQTRRAHPRGHPSRHAAARRGLALPAEKADESRGNPVAQGVSVL